MEMPLSRECWYQLDGEVYKVRVKEAECSGNVMYLYMKMEK
jgi:hypothetical protein